MKTNYFLMAYPGHGGGDWFVLMCNNHPAGMTVLIETFKEQMLDFKARGLDRRKDLDAELIRLFNFREGKDACVGLLKKEHRLLWRWMEPRGARRIQMVRNPLALIGQRMGRKLADAERWIELRYHRDLIPFSRDEFEGTVMKYAYDFYEKYLRRANAEGSSWPLIRLEDLNCSVGSDGQYFLRVMEWLTQTPWPKHYVDVIRTEYTPAYGAYSRAVFDGDFNLLRLLAWPVLHWKARVRTPSEWAEDVSSVGPLAYWNNWTEQQRGLYLKHMEKLQRRLGYNQDHIGSTDADWEFRGAYGKVDLGHTGGS